MEGRRSDGLVTMNVTSPSLAVSKSQLKGLIVSDSPAVERFRSARSSGESLLSVLWVLVPCPMTRFGIAG